MLVRSVALCWHRCWSSEERGLRPESPTAASNSENRSDNRYPQVPPPWRRAPVRRACPGRASDGYPACGSQVAVQAWRDRHRQRREAERRRVAEQERQRRIAEEQRTEAERHAKLIRRQACRQRISGSRSGCVQPIRERGGSDWYHYHFRNNCSYPISDFYGGQGDGRLSSLTRVPSRSKSPYMKPRGGLRYSACYDAPGVSGPSCEILSWACPD